MKGEAYNTGVIELLLLALLGWFSGISVNYLSDVLPVRRRLTVPICSFCGESMDLLNYLVWPRKCPHCGRRRVRSWVVEGVYILIPIWLWTSPPQGIPFLIALAMFIYFGIVVVIDLEHRLILHVVSLAGVVLGLLAGVSIHGWAPTLLGGLSGLGIMLVLYFLGWLLLQIMARSKGESEQAGLKEEEALGFGDVTLNCVLGLVVGWPLNLFGLSIAILIGGIVSLVYLVYKLLRGEYRSFMAVPYGPFLVAGAVVVLFFWKPVLAIL